MLRAVSNKIKSILLFLEKVYVKNYLFSHCALDLSKADKYIYKLLPNLNIEKKKVNPNRVALFATELYNVGGHSKCIYNMSKSLRGIYEEKLFLMNKKPSLTPAGSDITRSIKEVCEVESIPNKNDMLSMFKKIYEYNPGVIFVYIHPRDVYACAVLGMIKKYTDTKIIYFPHASHFPNIGITYADLSLYALSSTAYIDKKYKKCNKIHITLIGIGSISADEIPQFTKEQISEKRKEMGIKDGFMCTMSGASAYKFFDEKHRSEYFSGIKNFLERNKNVQHIVISNFNETELSTVKNIFKNSEEYNRLIILPFSKEYMLLFKCADLFIDSFPISSAYTFIELMYLKVPYVVKINNENSLYTFHEYQKPDFKYMYSKTDEFFKGAEFLLKNERERLISTEENYQHFLKTYERNALRTHLKEIIDNRDNLEQFYDICPLGEKYNINEKQLLKIS